MCDGRSGTFLTVCTALRVAWAWGITWTIPAASRFYTLLVSHLIFLSYAEYIGVYITAPVGTVVHKALGVHRDRKESLLFLTAICRQKKINNASLPYTSELQS